MRERRRKAKAKVQPVPLNIQQAAAEEKSDKSREVRDARMEKVSDYMLDISKYVLTGVAISSMFNSFTDNDLSSLYILSLTMTVLTFVVGILFTRKK